MRSRRELPPFVVLAHRPEADPLVVAVVTDTLPLFDADGHPDPTVLGTLTGRDHPDTSYTAAARAEPKSGTKRALILDRLRDVYPAGLTDEELQQQLRMPPNTQRPRRVELVCMGWIEDSGERVPSSTGSASIVWRACG